MVKWDLSFYRFPEIGRGKTSDIFEIMNKGCPGVVANHFGNGLKRKVVVFFVGHDLPGSTDTKLINQGTKTFIKNAVNGF